MGITPFTDLKKRFFISILSIAIVALLIFFAYEPIVQIIFVLVIAFVSIVGLWEYVNLLKVKQISLPFWLLSTGAFVWIVFLYFSLHSPRLYFLSGVALGVFALAVFLYYFNKIENATTSLSCAFFGFIYVVIPMGLMLKILYPYSTQDGRIWLAYLIAVTKSTDIGAYFCGKGLGKTKLAPMLSPNKTIIGAVGGFFCAIIISYGFYLIAMALPNRIFSLNWVQALVFGGFLGVLGQVGDLAESLIKRDANVKDSNFFPGVGGVLDMLDSLLFTAPSLYLIMKVL